MPTLVLYYPEKDKRWEVEVKGDRFSIGRSREVEVCVPHVSVSKRHLIVERRAGRYIYRDLGSRNGVFLNGFRLDQGALDEGDQLRVGSVLITFHREKPAVTALPAQAASRPPAAPGPQPALVMDEPVEGPEETFDGSETLALGAEDLADSSVAQRSEVPGPILSQATQSGSQSPAPRGRGGLSNPTLLAVVGAGVVLGIALGFAGGSGRHLPAARDEVRPGPQGAPPARLPESIVLRATEPLGPPAAIDDEETAARLTIRLFLDWVGRPPLAVELERLRGLSLEKLWLEVLALAPPAPDPQLEKLPLEFERLMGRKPKPEEHAALLKIADGDPAHYVFAVGTSRDYASVSHRRKRNGELLSRSILVDLTGTLPSRSQVEETVKLLGTGRKGLEPLVRSLAEAASAGAVGPRTGQASADWVRQIHIRMLLRAPTPPESTRAATALRSGPNGWQMVLVQLASSEEYSSY